MNASRTFYGDFLGLDVVMDLGWIVTYERPGERAGAIDDTQCGLHSRTYQ